jgi:hypothetical protein
MLEHTCVQFLSFDHLSHTFYYFAVLVVVVVEFIQKKNRKFMHCATKATTINLHSPVSPSSRSFDSTHSTKSGFS